MATGSTGFESEFFEATASLMSYCSLQKWLQISLVRISFFTVLEIDDLCPFCKHPFLHQRPPKPWKWHRHQPASFWHLVKVWLRFDRRCTTNRALQARAYVQRRDSPLETLLLTSSRTVDQRKPSQSIRSKNTCFCSIAMTSDTILKCHTYTSIHSLKPHCSLTYLRRHRRHWSRDGIVSWRFFRFRGPNCSATFFVDYHYLAIAYFKSHFCWIHSSEVESERRWTLVLTKTHWAVEFRSSLCARCEWNIRNRTPHWTIIFSLGERSIAVISKRQENPL